MDADTIAKYSSNLERSSWLLVFFGLMTQISTEFSFPSYNVTLAFWGCYSAFSKHGRATFGFITFTFFSLILDIVFCSINSGGTSAFRFCLIMFIVCMVIKAYCLYAASHFFASIGGAYSMETNMGDSVYNSFTRSSDPIGYYPPNSSQDDSQSLRQGDGTNNDNF